MLVLAAPAGSGEGLLWAPGRVSSRHDNHLAGLHPLTLSPSPFTLPPGTSVCDVGGVHFLLNSCERPSGGGSDGNCSPGA